MSQMCPDTSKNGTSRTSNRATVYEAADVLGITVDAIRKRMQRGTIPYERKDGRVHVLLDEIDELKDKSGKVQDNGQDTYSASRDVLVESLQDQVGYLRGELAVRSEELRRKDHIIAALTERIPELEAPQDAPEGRETASESTEGAEPPQEDADAQQGVKRPWWRRIFEA